MRYYFKKYFIFFLCLLFILVMYGCEKGDITNMKNLILKVYELLTVLVPFIIVYLVLNKRSKQKSKNVSKSHLLWTMVFVIYIYGVFHFTGAGTLYNLKMYGMELSSNYINIVPFFHDIDVVAYLQNILLFIPLGFLLPFIWFEFNNWKYIILFGFFFSLFIEISQLLNNRITDIDDLILNTLGVALGYLAYRLFIVIRKSNYKQLNHSVLEPIIYICAMFLGRFLLYNEFGLAKILFGF